MSETYPEYKIGNLIENISLRIKFIEEEIERVQQKGEPHNLTTDYLEGQVYAYKTVLSEIEKEFKFSLTAKE